VCIARKKRERPGRDSYATPTEFKRIFSEDINSLYLLSLLLTGVPDKAEECFVEGIGESTKTNSVFKEWARSWARRTIVQSAIRLIAPTTYPESVGNNVAATKGWSRVPVMLHAEVGAILELAPLERFVFVMSVLERYSDNDCSILLGCPRREIASLRTRALRQLGYLLKSRRHTESGGDNSAARENFATIATPLIAQYFEPPAWTGRVPQ